MGTFVAGVVRIQAAALDRLGELHIAVEVVRHIRAGEEELHNLSSRFESVCSY